MWKTFKRKKKERQITNSATTIIIVKKNIAKWKDLCKLFLSNIISFIVQDAKSITEYNLRIKMIKISKMMMSKFFQLFELVNDPIVEIMMIFKMK